MVRSFLSVLAMITLLPGCGSSSNVNGIWGKEDDGADSLYLEARAAYDRGDFDDAEKLVGKLLDRNPDNEAAAVLGGYISLSQGGIDPYQLARALINLSDTKSKSGSASKAFQGDAPTGGSSSSTSSNDAASLLSSLGTIISVDETDLDKLTEESLSDGVFSSSAVRVPKKITDEVRNDVDVLRYMNKSIKSICRFVSDDVKTADSRDQSDDCKPSDAPRKNTAKAHFLWAFSHLAEAIVYQTVLLYQTADSAETNFQKGASAINSRTVDVTNSTELSSFIADVNQFTAAVNSVFDTGEGSMTEAMLLDLNAVNLAFGAMAGLPESITSKISKVLLNIEQIGDAAGGGTTGKLTALKGQLTGKFSNDIATKVSSSVDSYLANYPSIQSYDDIAASNELGAEKKTEIQQNLTSMCSSYDSLISGVDSSKVTSTRPTTCPPAT